MNIYQFQKQNPEAVWETPPVDQVLQIGFEEMFCSLPGNCIDLVLTDPAYWTSNRWREMGTTARLGGHYDPSKRDEDKWFETIDEGQFELLLHETYRVLKDCRFAYIMCDWQAIETVYRVAPDQCWEYWKPLVWDKVNLGMGYHYRASYEFVVLFQKGKAKLRDLTKGDVLHFPRVVNSYPTEKPLRLFELLVKNATDEGDFVLDPFCGSGTTAAACHILNRHYLCGDVSKRAIEWTAKRLNALQAELV